MKTMKNSKEQWKATICILFMLAFCLPLNPVCILEAKSSRNTGDGWVYRDSEQRGFVSWYMNNTCEWMKVKKVEEFVWER